MKTTPPAQHPLAGSSPVHTRIRGYSSPIAAPGNQRRRAAQRAPTWDAQPAFLCFSLPGQGDWQFPALTTWRTLSFLVITKVPGLWTILWPRDQWCDTAKGSGACESRGQTRHSRYTAYPPAGPRLHVSLLAARARAAQGLPPLRLELPKVTTPRNPASRVCFVCEEGTKHEHHISRIQEILIKNWLRGRSQMTSSKNLDLPGGSALSVRIVVYNVYQPSSPCVIVRHHGSTPHLNKK